MPQNNSKNTPDSKIISKTQVEIKLVLEYHLSFLCCFLTGRQLLKFSVGVGWGAEAFRLPAFVIKFTVSVNHSVLFQKKYFCPVLMKNTLLLHFKIILSVHAFSL